MQEDSFPVISLHIFNMIKLIYLLLLVFVNMISARTGTVYKYNMNQFYDREERFRLMIEKCPVLTAEVAPAPKQPSIS